MVEPNRKDANHKPLSDNLRRLQAATDQAGQPLNIIELPMPRPVVFEQRRLPASYANFYIANGIVLVPVFNDPNDREALNTLLNAISHTRNRPHLFRRPRLGTRHHALHDPTTAVSEALSIVAQIEGEQGFADT